MKLLLLVVLVSAVSGQQQYVCFDGSSYIRYETGKNPINSLKDKISFKFHSTDASGLLLYADSSGLYGDHVLLELVNGKLRVQYQLGQNRTLKEDVIGDGLGDNVLSTVTLTRDKRKLEVIAFGGQADKKTIHIPGADDRLDINGNIYVGGYLNPKRDIPWKNRVNFKGCMIKAVFNDLDLLSGAPPNKKNGFTSERVRTTTSRNIPPKPMNFKKETFIKLEIQEIDTSDPTSYLTQLDGSLEFRTVLIAGTVFKATSVSLEFQKSQLMLKSGSTDLVSLPFPNGGSANDGRWFEVKFRVKDDLMEITLNNITNRIKPANRPEYGSQIILGYDENDEYRFIGCLRNIKLLGVEVTYQKIIDPYRQTPFAEKGELEEGCKASDPCVPNPCFHEAECLSYAKGIDCDCKKKYKKPLCQFSQYKTTCSEIKKQGAVNSLESKYFVDPDDSGPEPPMQVLCNFKIRRDEGQTEMDTKNAERREIPTPARYSERFSFKKEIEYEIPLTAVKAIVDRSQTCEQLVKYECRDAKLFNQPGGNPSSRWLSANGYLQYYWGGALHDSYKCACAYSPQGCADKNSYCNCDSSVAEGQTNADEGLLNVTRDLPVREVQFGGLTSLSQAIYSVRKIVCYGTDYLGAVTFVAPDGWVRLPPWDSPLGGDISFVIKTIFPKGVLIDHRSTDETHFFQVKIADESTIAVGYAFGTSGRRTLFAKMDSSLGKLNDNHWHKIHVIRTLWKLSVKIDDRSTTVVGEDEEKDSVDLTGDARSRLDIDLPMFVGSFWRFPSYRKGYVGCMKGFTVNGVLVDLDQAVDHLTHEPESLVIKGCGNACRVNQCPYGKCVEKYTSYECDCSDVPFYGKYCSEEIGANFENSAIHSSTVNFTTGQSQAEKMVLAFSTKPERTCSGTLFEILSQDERQYYKLVLLRDNELEFEFKLVQTLDPIKIKISAPHVRFCDTSRHIVYIERNSTYFIKYQVDRLAMVEQRYEQAAASVFDKPYYFYVGNNKIGNQQYHGCMSGVKFHLVMTSGVMKTVEPIREGTLSNDTESRIQRAVCGPSINTPHPMITRRVPGPTTPTDYPSTEFIRDFGIHEAEDSNWAVLIVVALLMMLLLVALVVLTIWFVMQHKNDYQILEKEDGTVIGTSTVRGGNASLASVPAGTAAVPAPAPPPSNLSQGNLSRSKSRSNDVFV